MGKLHDFALKHDAFTKQINGRMVGIIDGNQNLLNLNRAQLKKEHKTSAGNYISPKYRSKEYAALKGFTIPDLYFSGAMFKGMTIEANEKTFTINSTVPYAPKLIGQYGADIFGIPKTKQSSAKQITTTELIKQYKKACYSK